MINLNYEAEDYDPYNEYELIPNGFYKVMIVNITEEKSGPNSKHPGIIYWRLEFRVTEGGCKGKTVKENVHINSPNDIARGIAKRSLNGVAYALGQKKFNNANDLKLKPLQVEIDTEDNKWNRIKKYYKYSDVPAKKQAPLPGTPPNHQDNSNVSMPVNPETPMPDDEDLPF